MFVARPEYGAFFDAMECVNTEQMLLAANYIASDIAGAREAGKVGEEWLLDKQNALRFKKLVMLMIEGALSSRGAKDTLARMFEDTREPEVLAKENELMQESGREFLLSIVKNVIKDNQNVVNEYKTGKETALQYLIGRGIKESHGAANPRVIKEIFLEILRQ
jgi:aspartyl-tRNA(Asn)/glutamyl-tRNA(Gln) amidotransferase subunit B